MSGSSSDDGQSTGPGKGAASPTRGTGSEAASAETALAETETPVENAVVRASDQASASTVAAGSGSSEGDGLAGWQHHDGGEPLSPTTRYRVKREVARGGLGRIMLAEDRWLGRTVALKELQAGRGSVAARFRREALITARLEHPSIVPVHDAGHWAAGKPFYSMKMVSGRSLAEANQACDCLAERLALLPNVRAVADAIAYAHSRRIIHRDLKPANVMVGEYGETLVIDWGLAKDLGAGEEEPSLDDGSFSAVSGDGLTQAGSVLGTPSYMSPEQARGEEVDERTDVYALGAILYSVLAGAPPYTGATGGKVVARVLEGPPAPLSAREPEVPPDLVAIVKKAMARDPGARYPTAAELAEDLRRFTTGQLVSAHRYSVAALLRRWVARHRAVVGVSVVAALLLVVLGTLSIHRIVQKEELAREQKSIAEEQRTAAEAQRSVAEQRADRITLLQARSALATDPTAAVAWLKHVSLHRGTVAEVRTIAQRATSRGVARDVLHAELAVRGLAASPDGKRLAVPWNATSIMIFDLATRERRLLTGDHGETITLAFSPDGAHLASGHEDGAVLTWDLQTGVARQLGQHDSLGSQVVFSPDGRYLASSAQSPRVYVWNLDTGEQVAVDAGKALVWEVAFAPESARLAIASRDGLWLWQATTGRVTRIGADYAGVSSVAFAPRGARLAAGRVDGSVDLWDLSAGKMSALPGHRDVVAKLGYSEDGALLASVGFDGEVRVWSERTETSRRLTGHSGPVLAAQFVRGTDRLVSRGTDGTVRVWNTDTGDHAVLLGHAPQITAHAVISDTMLATADNRGDVRVWALEPSTQRLIGRAPSPGERIAVSPDRTHVAFPGSTGRVQLVDLTTGRSRALAGHQGKVFDVEFSPATGRLFSCGEDGTLRLWEAGGTGSVVAHRHTAYLVELAASPSGEHVSFRGKEDVVFLRALDGTLEKTFGDLTRAFAGMAFSPSGGEFATASSDGTIHRFDLATAATATLRGHSKLARRLVYSPDGTMLASCDAGGTALLWRLADGSSRPLEGACERRTAPVFAGDGTLVAVAGADHSIRLVAADGEPVHTLRGHEDTVWDMTFSDDGRFLVSASADGTARVWNLDRGTSHVLVGSGAGMLGAGLVLGGQELVTSEVGGEVRRWRDPFADPLPIRPEALRHWLASATSAEVAPGKRVESSSRD